MCAAAVATVASSSAAAADFVARHAGAPAYVGGGDGGALPAGVLRASVSAWPALGGNASAAGRRNAAYVATLSARACAVWDAGDGVALNGGVNVLEAADAALKPLPAPAEAPVYFGVRPRGGSGGGAGPPAWGGLTNPLAALSPTAYAWPRGYPSAQGEAERGGAGAGVAELVRLAAAAAAAGGGIRDDDIVVLQSALSGASDTRGGGGDASFRGKLPLVLLAPGAVAPYSALATLVRERGLWSLLLPPSAPPQSADVWRSYIAQAVFSLCGLRVGFVPPWASRAAAPAADADGDGDRTAQLLLALAEWVAERGATCAGGGTSVAGCGGAAALFEDAYLHLHARSVLAEGDVRAAQSWLLALRALGYSFPGGGAPVAPLPPLLSPARPPRLDAMDAHVAVHINNARDHAELAAPLWHAVHGAQYGSVTYHLDTSGQGGGAAPATFHAALSRGVGPPLGAPPPDPGWPPGYFAYESFLAVWAEGAGSAAAARAAVLWLHDDLVVDARAVASWLRGDDAAARARCVMLTDAPDTAAQLPPVAEWPGGRWWLPRLADEGARMVGAGVPCAARGGAPLADGQLWMGYSDGFAARRRCAGADAFVTALSALRAVGAFLEIALHSAARCGAAAAELGDWLEFSLWTDRRGDPFAYLEAAHGDAPPAVLHPLKLSDPVAVAVTLQLRDEAWAAEWKQL